MIRRLRFVFACALVLGAACASPQRMRRDGPDGVNIAITNRTAETVCFLYLSPPADDTWSDDMLGSGTLAPRTRLTVRLPPGVWDLRTENCQHEDTGLLRAARIARGTVLVLQ